MAKYCNSRRSQLARSSNALDFSVIPKECASYVRVVEFMLILLRLEYSHWARDIIFVASDDDLAGMQAWLSAYHEDVQSSKAHLCLYHFEVTPWLQILRRSPWL